MRAMRFPANAAPLLLLTSIAFDAVGQEAPAALPTAPPAQKLDPLRTPSPGHVPPANPGSLPEVSDPMLEPVEPALRVLNTWQQALDLVRSRSTSLAIARAQIQLAHSQFRQALASVLPSLSASAGVTKLMLPNGIPQVAAGVVNDGLAPRWGSGVSFSQRLLDLQAWDNTQISRRAVGAARVREDDAERVALAALADTIVGVITAERLAEVSRVSLRSNLSTLDLTRRRARLGAASSVDVLRSEQEVTSSRSDVIGANEALRRAREALGVALGDTVGWAVAPTIEVQQLSAQAQSVCTHTPTVASRNDVRAAGTEVQIAERRVNNQRFAFAPTVDLSSSFNYTSPTGALRPTQWQIRAVLSVPLYDGGRAAASLAQANANLEISQQRLTATERQATLEQQQAQRGVSVAQKNFEVSQEARTIARESARLAQIAFLHGTGTSFDLVESARRRRLAEIDVTLKEFEVVRAQITALLAVSNCSY